MIIMKIKEKIILENRMRYFPVILITAIIAIGQAFAQERESNSEPLPMPEMIIVGKANIDIRSGIKQFPDKPQSMSGRDLDSLNSLEKLQSLLLPPEPLPDGLEEKPVKAGYLKGSFGRFSTPEFEGGYGFDLNGYKFFMNGGLEISKGHIDNADYNKIFLNAKSDYIAPDKYWIFGGSKTRIFLNLKNDAYNLYALENAPDRNAMDIKAGVDSEGEYEGYQFSTGAFFESLSLSGKSADASDNGLNGYLSIRNMVNKFSMGGKINIDLRSYNGTGMNFLEGSAFGAYRNDNFMISLQAGFRTASNSIDINRSGLLLDADIEIKLNERSTIDGNISSGTDINSFSEMYRRNPYISDSAIIDFAYNLADISLFYNYHPDDKKGFYTGVSYKMSERQPVFALADTGTFNLIYPDADIVKISGSGFWQVDDKNKLSGGLSFNITNMDNNNQLPYMPALDIYLKYRHLWTSDFGTEIEILYFGSRYADIDNKVELDAVPDIGIYSDYWVSGNFCVFLSLENLLNSDKFIWQNYKGRNLFAKAGAVLKF